MLGPPWEVSKKKLTGDASDHRTRRKGWNGSLLNLVKEYPLSWRGPQKVAVGSLPKKRRYLQQKESLWGLRPETAAGMRQWKTANVPPEREVRQCALLSRGHESPKTGGTLITIGPFLSLYLPCLSLPGEEMEQENKYRSHLLSPHKVSSKKNGLSSI